MQHQTKFLRFSIFFFLLWIFSSAPTHANNPQKQCDSLIEIGIAKMRNNEFAQSITLLTKAHQIAENKHFDKQLFLAKNYLGGNYFMMLDYGEALNYYLAAYTIAVKSHDSKFEMMALSNIAILYAKEKKHDKARDYFERAYQLSIAEKDFAQAGGYALNLGLLLNEIGQYDKARTYFNKALEYAANNTLVKQTAQTAMAENDMLRGHTRESIAAAEQLLPQIRATKDGNAISLLLVVAKSYLKEKQFGPAIQYAQQALEANNNVEVKTAIYEILTDIHTQQKNYPEALRYKDSVMAYREKRNEIQNGSLFETSKARFEIQESKNQLSLHKAEAANRQKIFYWIIIAMTVVLLLLIAVWRIMVLRHKQRKMIAENNHRIVSLELAQKKTEAKLLEKQLHEEQSNALLEQEKLQSEIEHNNRKLSVKALYLSGKNRLVEDFLAVLDQQPEVTKIPAIRSHINSLKKNLRSDEEWESFLTHFEEVNQGFLIRLKEKHKDLSANDIRFICYVYMNLSSKEIASMLNISLDACRKRKERVAQKLGLSDSTSLYAYLSGI
ncbi:tetratricopeptide repeat protein [Flavobacterium sp.]|uniref:tetratricopeptide repeat protein n=1 Tax=Flavobacterium sp. TaxID=239 RepID=UPI0039E48A9C